MQTRNFEKSRVPLARVFAPETILVGLRSLTKDAAVTELIHRLVALGQVAPQEEQDLIASILEREKTGSTAIGNGIAMPHCRSRYAQQFLGALAIEPRGVAFDAVDGSPVHAVFLVIAPAKGRDQYYDVLGRIIAIGKDKTYRLHLRACHTVEAAHRLLQELDAS